MKLTTEEIQFIENTAKTAMLFNVDNLIIDGEGVKGLDDGRTVYLRQSAANVPKLSFESICITRIPLFLSRLDIAKKQENFHVDATVHSDDGWVQCLTFKGKGTKIEYRGSNPIKTKIPKGLNDDRSAQVRLNGEVVLLMQKGQAAMGAELVNIINNDEVTFEFMDVNKDVFSYTFPNSAESLTTDSDAPKFAHKYPIKLVLALFKQEPDGFFSVGGRIGTLSVNVEGIDVYIIPQK